VVIWKALWKLRRWWPKKFDAMVKDAGGARFGNMRTREEAKENRAAGTEFRAAMSEVR
jgi:hypothetical protein